MDLLLFCYTHRPRQPSLGQNHLLINTFHRVNGALAPLPAWEPLPKPRALPSAQKRALAGGSQCQFSSKPASQPSQPGASECIAASLPRGPQLCHPLLHTAAYVQGSKVTVLWHLICFSSSPSLGRMIRWLPENPLGRAGLSCISVRPVQVTLSQAAESHLAVGPSLWGTMFIWAMTLPLEA